MNMRMLKSFFEIGGNPALFDGLNFESASAALRTLIGNEARRFDFLRSSVRLSEDEKESYARLTKTGSGEDGGSKPANTLSTSRKALRPESHPADR